MLILTLDLLRECAPPAAAAAAAAAAPAGAGAGGIVTAEMVPARDICGEADALPAPEMGLLPPDSVRTWPGAGAACTCALLAGLAAAAAAASGDDSAMAAEAAVGVMAMVGLPDPGPATAMAPAGPWPAPPAAVGEAELSAAMGSDAGCCAWPAEGTPGCTPDAPRWCLAASMRLCRLRVLLGHTTSSMLPSIVQAMHSEKAIHPEKKIEPSANTKRPTEEATTKEW
jgi:hypothetical protein